MICKQCKDEEKQSKVYPVLSSTTLMGWAPYYDKEGKYHNHDPNTTTTRLSCSNGHSWVEKTQKKCWCEQ
jgi:hypothetical protein